MPERSEVPEGWVYTPLSLCVDILDYRRIPINSEDREKRVGDIPYYGATGQIGWIDNFLFDEELLLIGEDGAPFFDKSKPIAYLIRGKSWVNNHAHVLRAIEGITSNEYLKHFLDSFDFNGYVTGTTRYKLNQGSMTEIPIRLPPLPEQYRIVATIEALFARLDAANARLERVPGILKQFRQAVLAAACDGRLTEDWRAEDSCNVQHDGTNKRVNLPDSWATLYLPDIVEKNANSIRRGPFGSAIKKAFFVPDGIKIYEQKNVIYNDFSLGNYYISEDKFLELQGFEVKADDILITCSGTVGKIAVVPENVKRGIINQALLKLSLNKAIISPAYFIHLFNLKSQQIVSENTRGSAMKNISSVNDLKQIPFYIPPLPEQHEIVRRVDALFALADRIEAEVAAARAKTETMRQSILAQAFSGRLVPTEAELARREGRAYEPASVLLERIRSGERAKKAGKESQSTLT